MSVVKFDWSKVQVRQVNGSPRPRRKKAAERAAAGVWMQFPLDRGLKLAKCLGCPALAVLLVLDLAIYDAHSNHVKTLITTCWRSTTG